MQFNNIQCVYIKYMYNSECCLHLTTNGKGEVLRQTLNITPSCSSLYTHAHIFRASVNPHSSANSYAVLLLSPSDPEPQTSRKDSAEES
jgi:hypothetical protein